MTECDFFLASSEGYQMEEPRRCKRVKRIRSAERDDLLLARIDPPLVGQLYGLGAENLDMVLLAPRHRGDSLFPIREWPVCVHVARLLIDNPAERDHLEDEEFELIAWAELYPTEQAAKAKRM